MNALQASPPSGAQRGADSRASALVRILLPVAVLAAGVMAWDLVVRINQIPPYVLPVPLDVFRMVIAVWPVLWSSLLTTLRTTLAGFIAAAVGGIALALLFNQSKWVEDSVFSLPVLLQGHP